MNQFLFPEEDIPDKEVKIIKNGEKNLKKGINIFLHTKLTIEDVAKICKKRLKMNSDKNFRLFTEEGVELFNEDLRYVPYDSTLYASEGQDYDSSSQFAQYKKSKVIGQGGFGKVVLGEHRVTKQKVAIKFIENEMTSAAEIDQVYKEAETMKNLQHKNIVEIYSTYTLKNLQTVLIMEYLEGGELLDLLQEKGRLDEEEAREYFAQMIEAIQYCHNEKLIHRDLKPENIMLYRKDSKQIKIVDFGISSISNNFKLDKTNIGSLKYMAPEVLANKVEKIGPPIDLWALGVILYAMICNELPFDGPNPKVVAQKIIAGKFDFPPDLNNASHQVKDLICCILRTNVAQRYTLKDIRDHPWMLMDLSQQNIKSENKKYARINNLQKQTTSMGGYRSRGIGTQPTSSYSQSAQNNKPKINISQNSSNVSEVQQTQNKLNNNNNNDSQVSQKDYNTNNKANLLPNIQIQEGDEEEEEEEEYENGRKQSQLNVKTIKYNPNSLASQNNNYINPIQISQPQQQQQQQQQLLNNVSTVKSQVLTQQNNQQRSFSPQKQQQNRFQSKNINSNNRSNSPVRSPNQFGVNLKRSLSPGKKPVQSNNVPHLPKIGQQQQQFGVKKITTPSQQLMMGRSASPRTVKNNNNI